MNSGLCVLFLAMLVGFSFADWWVAGYCDDGSNQVGRVEINNGNCAPMSRKKGSLYVAQLITTANNRATVSNCSDQLLAPIALFKEVPIVSFVDCKTTPKFDYTSTSDPEPEVIKKLLGGSAFGSGTTFGSCVT